MKKGDEGTRARGTLNSTTMTTARIPRERRSGSMLRRFIWATGTSRSQAGSVGPLHEGGDRNGGSNWGRPRRCSQAKQPRGTGGPLVCPRPCSRVGAHAAATRFMAGRAVSSVPCPVCFGIGSVECLPCLAVLTAPHGPIQNSESGMQNADSATGQGTGRHRTPHPPGRPWCVVAGSRFHVSNQWRAGAGVGPLFVHTRDTAPDRCSG